MSVSDEAAKRLRPVASRTPPPGAQPIGATVDLVVENSPLQPEVFITDTRRATWFARKT